MLRTCSALEDEAQWRPKRSLAENKLTCWDNIRKTGKDNYAIEVALAGFSKNDVEVEFEENLLTVRTKQVNKSENKNEDGEILHKGISQRQFARSFTIADDVKVGGAELKDGLLTIACERIVPEQKKKKLIEIK